MLLMERRSMSRGVLRGWALRDFVMLSCCGEMGCVDEDEDEDGDEDSVDSGNFSLLLEVEEGRRGSEVKWQNLMMINKGIR